MSVLSKLKGAPLKPIPARPVWKGPEVDGITYSLLCRFLCCRERFRILTVEGLKPAESFNHRLEYGQMWHTCEEALAAAAPTRSPGWQKALLNYCQRLCGAHPTQQQQIDHWYNVCKVQFPIYVDWWAKHLDVAERRPLLQEQVFDVPYRLPSGRTVRLRGKWDSVDLIGSGKEAGVYLQENKTKGDIDEIQLRRQLASGFDLQTMLYLVALGEYRPEVSDKLPVGMRDNYIGSKTLPLLGIRYNVVRRPLSGGKGSIVQHKPTKSNPRGESSREYYARLAGIIKEDPAYYFMRWKVEIGSANVARFRRECLDPILENLLDWWEWIRKSQDNFSPNDGCESPCRHLDGGDYDRPVHSSVHWRHPFGVYNVLDEGGSSDLDIYLASGSEVGLQRTDNLFPELS